MSKNPHAVALGRLGGKKGGLARAASMTPEQRSEAARKAGSAPKKKRTPKIIERQCEVCVGGKLHPRTLICDKCGTMALEGQTLTKEDFPALLSAIRKKA